MKKTILATVLIGLSSIATASPYVQGSIGYTKSKSSYDGDNLKNSGTAYQIAVGTTTKNNLRYAVDYTQHNKITDTFDTEKVSVKASSIGGSAFYDFNTPTAFTPYVGARIALNHIKANIANISDADSTSTISKNRIGYGVISGVNYKINTQLTADANLQYNYLGKLKEAELKHKKIGINVGLRYQF